MRPKTADVREDRARQFIEYAITLNKGQLAEVQLTRLNRVANFRRALIDLINDMIEERAQDLAAGMLMEWAPERAKRKKLKLVEDVEPLKAKTPKWVRDNSEAILKSLK